MIVLIFNNIFKVYIIKYWNEKVGKGLRDRNPTLEKTEIRVAGHYHK